MEGKQGHVRIASRSAQNRVEGFEDFDAVVQRLRIADDLVRELSARLLARHDELRQIRSGGRLKSLSAAVLLLVVCFAQPVVEG